MIPEKNKLNIGCGMDIRKGWINLDSAELPGIDIVHDLNVMPLPFKDGRFAEIAAIDVLEHIHDYIPVMKELHRIMSIGGRLTISVPHFTSKNAYTDPTHKSFFAFRTFYFFTKASLKSRSYYFDFHFSAAKSKITFEHSSRWFFLNRFVEKIVNRSDRARYLYESTFMSAMFPAQNIITELIK